MVTLEELLGYYLGLFKKKKKKKFSSSSELSTLFFHVVESANWKFRFSPALYLNLLSLILECIIKFFVFDVFQMWLKIFDTFLC